MEIKAVRARTLFLVVSVLTVAMLVAIGAMATFYLASGMRTQEAERHAAVLIRALSTSLQNDLLSSNILTATDRARSLLSDKTSQWTCFSISPSEEGQGARSAFRIGNTALCDDSRVLEKSETVYYDADQTQPAFRLRLKYSAELLPSVISDWLLTVPALILAFALIATLGVSFLIQKMFSLVEKLILSDVDFDPVFFGIRVLELQKIRQLLAELLSKRNEVLQAKIASERSEAVREIAVQLSHDIRSPMSALNMVMAGLSGIPEERKRMIKNIAARVNEIADGLLKHEKALSQARPTDATVTENQTGDLELVMVEDLIDGLLAEKRIQYRESSIDLQFVTHCELGVSIKINRTELSRVVSNLINNSVEARTDRPLTVVLDLSAAGNRVRLSVKDNGKGIPHSLLSQLGTRGVSFGKEGAGLGLFHAKKTVEAAGGIFSLESTVGEGTLITLDFPKTAAPEWMAQAIVFGHARALVSVDDDRTIHGALKDRLKQANLAGLPHLFFLSGEAFSDWYQASAREPRIYLFDFELSESQGNGLDLIERFNLASQSFLITSRFDDPAVQEKCMKLGVRIIPKPFASRIPFVRLSSAGVVSRAVRVRS